MEMDTNREEIMQLDGPALDEAVAERVMGWEQHPHKTGWIVPDKPQGQNYIPIGNFCPSIDIAHAWEVVGNMIGEGYHFSINDTVVEWRAMFVPREQMLVDNFIIPDEQYTAWESTAPLAICRAALLAALDIPAK